MKTRAQAAWLGTVVAFASLGVMFQPKATEPPATAVDEAPAKPAAPFGHDGAAVSPTPLRREPIVVTATDPFETLQQPPAPPPKAPATPAVPPASSQAPEAPPLPYRYFGTMIDVSGTTITYLAHGTKVFPIQAGDTIEGSYHIDAIDEKEIALTYLPLQSRLSLRRISASN